MNIKIDKLKPSEYNPRKASKKQVEDVKKSIERFGLVDPIIVNSAENRKDIVIGGHLRLEVAKDMGIKEVPVVYVNIPDIEKEKELNIRLNKNIGDFDYDLLANFDEDLLKDVGFESEELDKIFDLDLEANPKDDEVPDVQKETNIKYGDIFQLGNHRIMCGDATKKEDLEKLMNGKKADMVFTAPPYNVDYSTKNEYLYKIGIGKGNRKKPITNDNIKDFDLFCNNFLSNLKDFLNEYNSVYLTYTGVDLITLLNAIKNNDYYFSQILIWLKNRVVFGRLNYLLRHELIIYCWYGKHKFYGNKQQSVWEVDKPVKSDLHPTMKPIELIEKAILNSSQREEIVLDLFLGSGSTLIACEKTNRICYGMELEPLYVQVIIDRWEKLTGNKAVKVN
jgi:DNA modification methylase